MARDHGRILTTIWQDTEWRKLTARQQRLYILLLSQPTINNAGVLPMQLSKWQRFCTDIDSTELLYDLHVLQERRFVFYDDETEEVLVRSYIRRDGLLKHPNLFTNALRCAESVESPTLRNVLAGELVRTRRNDAKEAAERLKSATTFERHPDGVPTTFERHPDVVSTSFESRTSFERRRDPCGEGEGEGEGEPYVATHLGEKPPPKNCEKHKNELDPPPCGRCAAARRAHDAWTAEQAAARKTALKVFWEAVSQCSVCDPKGWGPGGVRCPEHDWAAITKFRND